MKKKFFLTFAIMITAIVSMVSLGFNIFFLATKPQTASGIFNACKFSIVELKAESENVGTSYGTAVIISDDGTMITNAHNITYSQLGQTYSFDNISIRFVDEENYRSANIIKFDLNLDLAVIKLDIVDRKLQPIKIGDSTILNSGDEIFTIGNSSNKGMNTGTSVYNSQNTVAISKNLHHKISGYYSSLYKNGQTFRHDVNALSYEQQYIEGLRVLSELAKQFGEIVIWL